MLKTSVATLCALILLAGCVTPPNDGTGPTLRPGIDYDALTGNVFANGPMQFGTVDRDFPRAGMTYATHDPFHGVQVEYFAPGGRAHLWYPGNTRTVTGEWAVRGNDLCFRYQANSYNPVTGQQGGEWDCRNRARAAQTVVSMDQGDPFALASGRVPAHNLRSCRLPGEMKQMRNFPCFPRG